MTLPYDAIRDLPRSADSDEGPRTGSFPGGPFEYLKTFDLPEEYRGAGWVVEVAAEALRAFIAEIDAAS